MKQAAVKANNPSKELGSRLGLEAATGILEMSGFGVFPPPPGKISPIAVFRVLHGSFGAPNSPQNEGVDWGWILQSKLGKIGIWSMYGFIFLGPELAVAKNSLDETARQLVAEFQKASARPQTGKPVGELILNTYRTYAHLANTLTELAKSYESPVATHPESPGDWPNQQAVSHSPGASDTEENKQARQAIVTSAIFAHIVSLEGFLNLVYYLYLRPDLADERMRDRLERQELDVKLRLIGVFCDCFADPPISRNDEVFKAFCHLADIRKNLAHAKLLPAMTQALVVEQNRYPFFVSTGQSTTRYGISADPSDFTFEMLEKVSLICWILVAKLCRAMRPDVRRDFVIAHFGDRIRYMRDEAGQAKILLGVEEDKFRSELAEDYLKNANLNLALLNN